MKNITVKQFATEALVHSGAVGRATLLVEIPKNEEAQVALVSALQHLEQFVQLIETMATKEYEATP